MEKAIAKLIELGHVKHIHDSAWLSKPLLTPKPHQENVTNIDNFVWHFCVNYIALNSITRLIAMPIPRCNSAVGNSFGNSKLCWLTNAGSGYNQIRVSIETQAKLAFAGPNCSKYAFLVMLSALSVDQLSSLSLSMTLVALGRHLPSSKTLLSTIR